MAVDPMLIDDDDRYSRLRLIAWWDQIRLANSKILVVGAGALGNEVLKNLVLLGIGQIYVVDFDTIEPSNLARSVLFRGSDRGKPKSHVAAERARDLNPDCRVIPLNCDVMHGVGLGIYRDVDVVIGCLDNREARLWVNRCCWRVGTPWIDGAIQEISGIVRVFEPPNGPCYECGMTEVDYQLINVRYSCPLLRREDMAAGRAPTTPTIASIVAGWQCQEAIKLLHKMPTAAGKSLVYNGLTNHFYTTELSLKPDCLSHEIYSEPLVAPLSAGSASAADLFRFVNHESNGHFNSVSQLVLDWDLVLGLSCSGCGSWQQVLRPARKVSQSEAICAQCSTDTKPVMIHTVDEGSLQSELKLCQLGVPEYDIVKVRRGSNECHVLLAEDRHRVDSGR